MHSRLSGVPWLLSDSEGNSCLWWRVTCVCAFPTAPLRVGHGCLALMSSPVLSTPLHWTQARFAQHHCSRRDSHKPRELRQVAPVFICVSHDTARARPFFSLPSFSFSHAPLARNRPHARWLACVVTRLSDPLPLPFWVISVHQAAQ